MCVLIASRECGVRTNVRSPQSASARATHTAAAPSDRTEIHATHNYVRALSAILCPVYSVCKGMQAWIRGGSEVKVRGRGHKSILFIFLMEGSKRTEQSGDHGSDKDLMIGTKEGERVILRSKKKRDKVNAALSLGAFIANS